MSFSAEITDFVNGMKAGAAIGGDVQDRKLLREKFEFDKAFKEGSAARADRALDIKESYYSSSAADRKARADAKAADKADKEAAKAADKAHKAEVKDFNEITRSEGGGGSRRSGVEYSDEWEDTLPEEDSSDTDTYDESAIPVREVTGEEVRLASGGGVMDDSEEQESADGKSDSEAVEAAIPVAASQAAPTAEGPKPAEGKEDPVYSEAATVAKDVMDTMESELGEQPEAISTKKTQDRIADVKPATPAEMKAIWEQVDPNHELDGQVKGATALVKAYRFFTEKGDSVKARKVAAQIIKFNQDATKMQGMLALEALRVGDLSSASRLITDAATENVPDGVTVQAQATPKGTVLYKIDKAGYAQQQGELGASEMWKLAAGVADGSMFMKRMAVLAGQAKVGEEEPVVTSGGKKDGKKRSYSADVAAAAQAKKDYDDLKKRYDADVSMNGADSETSTALGEQLQASYQTYKSAWELAQKAAKETKRPDSVLAKDFRDRLSLAVAPPPGIPTEGDKGDSEAAVATESAIPPAPAAAPAAPAGRPMDPDTMAKAKAAIAEGRSRAGVIEKLNKLGFNTEGL